MTFITRCLFAFLILLCISQSSCRNQGDKETSAEKGKAENQNPGDTHPIKIVILDDDLGNYIALKNKISREFGNLELGKVQWLVKTSDEFFTAPEQGDLLFYPPHVFGELVQKNLIKSIPDYIVESEPYQKSDVYKNQRRTFGVHNKTLYGLSLGVSSFSLLVNKAALAKHGIDVPTTWSEYRLACLTLATQRKNGELEEVQPGQTWSPTIEPTKGNWLAATFMARAGAYVRTRGKYSVMFDYSSWKPIIQSAPFVSTLNDLISAFELMDIKHQNLSPREVELAFLRGECFMAITWPHPPSIEEQDLRENVSASAVFPLPGSESKYDASAGKWVAAQNAEKHVAFLGAGGLCGSVLNSSEQSGVATRRLGLLAGKEFSSLTGTVNSESGVPYRASHVSKIESWISASYPSPFAESLATVTEKQNQAPLWMIRSRVDQSRKYESTLASAIRDAMKKEETAESVLNRLQKEWMEINKSVDTDFQKQISLEGLGVK